MRGVKSSLLLALLAGCGHGAAEARLLTPRGVDRLPPIAVLPPAPAWSLDPDRFQLALIQRLREMGYADVAAARVPPKSGRMLLARAERMERPPDDDGGFASGPYPYRRSFGGERVRADIAIVDAASGEPLYDGVYIATLASSLTEDRVASALLAPLR
jgi:hypothetical protein